MHILLTYECVTLNPSKLHPQKFCAEFYLCNISKRLFILHQHLCKLLALVWIDSHDVSQQENPVRSVANLHRKST